MDNILRGWKKLFFDIDYLLKWDIDGVVEIIEA